MSKNIDKYIYKVQEAAVYLALLDICNPENIFWDPKKSPAGVKPDIITGKSVFKPETVFMITHGRAQNAQQTKAWRDLYEFFFYAEKYPDTKLVRVYFGHSVSEYWNNALNNFLDMNIRVEELPNGKELSAFLNDFLEKEGAETNKSVLMNKLKPFTDKPLFEGFKKTVKKAVEIPKLKTNFPNFPKGDILKPFFPTSLRRFAAFSGIFPEIFNKSVSEDIIAKLEKSFIARETVWGLDWQEPFNSWISSSLKITGKDIAMKMSENNRMIMQRYRQRWENAEFFIEDFYKTAKLLKKSNNPPYILKKYIKSYSCKGKQVAFLMGLRYLSKLNGSDKFGNSYILKKADMEASTGMLYKLSKLFEGGLNDIQEQIYESLSEIIVELYEQIKSLNLTHIYPKIFHLIFYDEAVKNRHLEPIPFFLEQKFSFIKSEFIRKIPTMVESAGKAGTVRVFKRNNTIVHWKTAHRGHKDKTKELAAKGMALRLQHREVKNFILIIDGEWSEKDLNILANYGWSLIVPFSFFSLPESEVKFEKLFAD